MKNELEGSATQELRGWGVGGGGSQWNEQGNWGLNLQTPSQFEPWSWMKLGQISV